MGSGLDDCVYWQFFTITVNYNNSHVELLLKEVCVMNNYEESLATEITWTESFYLEITLFWDETLCNIIKVYRRLGRTCWVHRP
jgi:hypothetical protein